jgi:hypothetical protein
VRTDQDATRSPRFRGVDSRLQSYVLLSSTLSLSQLTTHDTIVWVYMQKVVITNTVHEIVQGSEVPLCYPTRRVYSYYALTCLGIRCSVKKEKKRHGTKKESLQCTPVTNPAGLASRGLCGLPPPFKPTNTARRVTTCSLSEPSYSLTHCCQDSPAVCAG